MRVLLKIGFSLLLLAMVLTTVAYVVLRNHGVSGSINPGSRLLATDTRKVTKNVTSVELAGPIDLTVRYGPVPSLEVRGEQRLLSNIDTTVDGDKLRIALRGLLLSHRRPLQATVVLPALSNLSVTGSGDTKVDGFSGEHVELQLAGPGSITFNARYRQVTARLHGSGDFDLDVGNSDRVDAQVVGSGTITLAGSCTELAAETTGSGEINARHLRADKVDLRQFGTGDSSVSARTSVTVSVNGNGDVEVYGNPPQRSVSRSGNGDVTFNE
ncbi:head GIN domain-containing protein [Massilia terrae]|uniref:DUF2807 domain-containing protein n=1 Tax=Massilia terrae TaxID=1811224 RepID=A0ABT2CUA3_9BURK|nr:head GIN domain-containing protein [Massilia terrae]MCS0657370.1 DUF2807 domain-containing protein [Massilia terrae]